MALKSKKVNLSQKPKFDKGRNVDDEPQIDEEGDPNMDMGEMIEEEEEDMEENIFQGQTHVEEDKQMIISKTDSKQWILECERVSSKLKFAVKATTKDWRIHLDHSRQYSSKIQSTVPGLRTNIERVSDNLQKVLDEVF